MKPEHQTRAAKDIQVEWKFWYKLGDLSSSWRNEWMFFKKYIGTQFTQRLIYLGSSQQTLQKKKSLPPSDALGWYPSSAFCPHTFISLQIPQRLLIEAKTWWASTTIKEVTVYFHERFAICTPEFFSNLGQRQIF